jgi:hypothetical protein
MTTLPSPRSPQPGFAFVILLVLASALSILAPAPARAEEPPAAAAPRDGQHDFDFLLGRWRIQLRKLKAPLRGAQEWVEYSGTSTVRPIWGGRANMEELEAEGPAGRIEGLTLRLYSPTSRQWALYYTSPRAARLEYPTIGEFKDGRGEFYDQEPYEGRSILVRYVWSDVTPRSCHFEQAFSVDGGKSWEVNWIVQFSRVE